VLRLLLRRYRIEHAASHSSLEGRRVFADEQRDRALELVAAGSSRRRPEQIGASKASVGAWVRAVRRAPSGHLDSAARAR
jgi:hypothetical protein